MEQFKIKQNGFKEQYRNYSTIQLVEILDNKDNFQADAVNAAESELRSRNISSEELKELYIQLEQNKILQKSPKGIFLFLNNFKEKISALINKYNLISNKSPEKIVHLFGIMTLFSLIFSLLYNIKLYFFIFFEPGNLDYSVLLLVLPFAYLITALVLLFKKSNIGLSMFIGYFAFNIMNAIFSYIYELQLGKPETEGLFGLFDSFIRKGFFYYFTEVLLYAALLYFVNTKPFNGVFKLEKKTYTIVILSVFILSSALFVYKNIMMPV